MRRSLGLLTTTVAAVFAFACLPVVALADGPKPTIESLSVAHVTSTDATLEAQINPGSGEDGFSLETTYEFFLESPWCGTYGPGACEASGGVLVYKGMLPAGSAPQVVSVDLASVGHALSPDTTYGYRVVAANGAGEAFGGLRAFTTPAATAPAIESESVSHVTRDDATLEAQINAEGLKDGVVYQFQVVTNTSEYQPEIVCPETNLWLHPWLSCGSPTPGALPIGVIYGNELGGPAKSKEVSLDLATAGVTLKPGTTYHYRILAAKRVLTEDTLEWEAPPVYGADRTFTTPPAPPAPVIDSVAVSHLTATDATLEAQIDTEGLPTLYEFRLTYTRCRLCEDLEPTYRIPLPFGLLLGSFQTQSVSLDLSSAGVTLKPGFYEYSLSAISEAGDTEAQGGSFEAPEEPVAEPLGGTVTPGPVSNEPEVPRAGGQQPASTGSSSPAPAAGSTPATAVPSKPAHGKPSTKHGKRRKHRGTNVAQHPAKGKKHKR